MWYVGQVCTPYMWFLCKYLGTIGSSELKFHLAVIPYLHYVGQFTVQACFGGLYVWGGCVCVCVVYVCVLCMCVGCVWLCVITSSVYCGHDIHTPFQHAHHQQTPHPKPNTCNHPTLQNTPSPTHTKYTPVCCCSCARFSLPITSFSAAPLLSQNWGSLNRRSAGSGGSTRLLYKAARSLWFVCDG